MFKLGILGLLPFGRDIDTTGFATGCLGVIMNIIWLVAGGIELAILHVVLALILAVTVVGLPFAKQHIKMARLALMPFGSVVD